MSKRLLFISSANLTTNPRIAKEIEYAISLGFEVDFVGFRLGNWSDQKENEKLKKVNVQIEYISAGRKPFLQWIISSLIEKLAKIIYPLFKSNIKVCAYAHSKRSWLLYKHLKKRRIKYDLIIAHTLPTIYTAFKLSQKTDIPFTFDIEDYHPGEQIKFDAINEIDRREYLMKKVLPHASYITYASPMIGEETIKLINQDNNGCHILINNCFSKEDFRFYKSKNEKIRFVWFSQNIAENRGLEIIVPALSKYKDKLELTLIGNLYHQFYEKFLKDYSDFITILKPLSPKELNLKICEFDIGLAIELNTADYNRQLCLTNKIWAYMQAGLYVLATDTPAQKQFLSDHKGIGTVTEQSIFKLETTIEKIIQESHLIRKEKAKRYNLGQMVSWENEQIKLKQIWEKR